MPVLPSVPLDLQWLPPPGDSFRADVRRLRELPALDQALARSLATQRLDLAQLTSLARALPSARIDTCPGRLRLSILSNTNVDLLAPAVVATAPRHGLWLDVATPPFGTVAAEALDPASATHQRQDDYVLLALDHRGLPLTPCPGDRAAAERAVAAALEQVVGLTNAIRAAGHAVVMLQTLAAPAESLLGSVDAQTPGTLRWMIERFNHQLSDTQPPGCLVLDVATLAAKVGLDAWHDPGQWLLGKFAFAQKHAPVYAEWLCRLIAAARGKSRKCLVLDLDNTLWGGVIGDDGLDGVVLGQGSPVGEAHLAVQAAALALRARGVVLAVSSKNDDAVARQMFQSHPEMLLREEHIAVFQANWQDKASNLRAIAQALGIGIDALVLLDDNPAEREQVRRALPEVAVPELPAEPDAYAAILLSAGLFESIRFTAEDRDRAGHYQANAARQAALGTGTDLAAYLAALGMEAQLAPFDAVGRGRITQLINKTNQFNLTTRRYAEADMAALEADPAVLTLQVRLKDRYGDNGMISVVICRTEGDALGIDTWLMSCRVLNRRVEEMVLNHLVAEARRRGARRLLGRYVPTERNALVRQHFERLGFEAVSTGPEGSVWQLDVASFVLRDVPISVSAVSPVSVGA